MKSFSIALLGAVFLPMSLALAADPVPAPLPSSVPSAEEEAAALTHLQPHRAAYRVSLLQRPGQESELKAATGSYQVSFTASCTGTGNLMRMNVDLVNHVDQKSHIVTETSVWESRDGASLTFNSSSRNNDQNVDHISGGARLEGLGGPGVASLIQGSSDAKELKIPAGTLFPSSLTLSLVRAAVRGTQETEATVFDGMDVNAGLAHMAIDILPPRAVSEAVAKVEGINPADKVWDFSIRTKRPGLGAGAPAMTGRLSLMKNGVAESMEYSMGGATLLMTLEHLELTEIPDCP